MARGVIILNGEGMMRRWQWFLAGAALAFGVLLTAVLLIGKKRRANQNSETLTQELEGPPGDREMSFWEHLAELRTRLVRAIVYWVLGSGIGWYYYDAIWHLLLQPVKPIMKQFGVKAPFMSPFEPLMLKLQISLAAGLVIAFPFILYEIMGFIWPALYPHEKRFALKLVPASLSLFAAGVYLAYRLIPFMAIFMLRMGMPNDPDVIVFNVVRPYMWFVAKIVAASGLIFQMPLVMMFLGKLNIISAAGLLRYWRHAIVAIFTLAAIITPTIDPVNMTLLAGPIVGLYFLSVLLVALVQRKRQDESS